MKITQIMAIGALLCVSLSASAGNWHDRYDRANHYKRSFKQTTEYQDGNCKVKRKFKKDGSYEEKRKCKAPSYGRNYQSNDRYYRDQRHDAANFLPAIIEPLLRVIN